jgi:hypothetical protein
MPKVELVAWVRADPVRVRRVLSLVLPLALSAAAVLAGVALNVAAWVGR